MSALTRGHIAISFCLPEITSHHPMATIASSCLLPFSLRHHVFSCESVQVLFRVCCAQAQVGYLPTTGSRQHPIPHSPTHPPAHSHTHPPNQFHCPHIPIFWFDSLVRPSSVHRFLGKPKNVMRYSTRLNCGLLFVLWPSVHTRATHPVSFPTLRKSFGSTGLAPRRPVD